MGKLKRAANRLPYWRKSLDALRLVRSRPGHPPGHYYSPIPSVTDVRAREDVIWPDQPDRTLHGLDLHETEQLELLEQLAVYHNDQPFRDEPSPRVRYFFNNDFFSPADAIILHCIMRHLRPAHVIEVGSGFSSAVMLDTNEQFLDGSATLTFIDPHPDRLLRLMKPGDRQKADLLSTQVQDVDLAVFDDLAAQDILFIDSSHVAKTGSDVNTVLFDVLPRLSPGVWIHFHDIFFPFEYPKEYTLDRRWSWNESYILHAFLQYNSDFCIRFFPPFLEVFHSATLELNVPLAMRHPMNWPTLRGASIWLQRMPRATET